MGVHLAEVLTLYSFFVEGVGLAGGPQAGAITWIITGCFLRRPFSAFECDPKLKAVGGSFGLEGSTALNTSASDHSPPTISARPKA